jgi:hypothetical protein
MRTREIFYSSLTRPVARIFIPCALLFCFVHPAFRFLVLTVLSNRHKKIGIFCVPVA